MSLIAEIGGARFHLECAAISAIRYRAAYGDSVLCHLSACATGVEHERVLLRLVHTMIPDRERPGLRELARRARRDGAFLHTALVARDALLAADPKREEGGEESGEPFDEYQLLALMATAGLDARLAYELPLLHLVGVVARAFELRDPERVEYHEMTPKEMAKLYPR